MTECFDRVPGPDNAEWLMVKTIVEDPSYLTRPFITSAHFMREPDGSKWNPTPCEVDPPLQPPCLAESGLTLRDGIGLPP